MLNRGLTASAALTTALRLSGPSTLYTPPKYAHAASQPAIAAVSVWEYVNHTNMCRDRTAVKIGPGFTQLAPDRTAAMTPLLGSASLAVSLQGPAGYNALGTTYRLRIVGRGARGRLSPGPSARCRPYRPAMATSTGDRWERRYG